VACDGNFIGRIIIGDRVRRKAKSSILQLKKSGVRNLYILSGDSRKKVESTALEIGIDNYEGNLLPEDKYAKLKEIIYKSQKTAFVGDGINDSPSLALADVGIAMGGVGSDSAIEAADVVIMNDDLSKIPKAKSIAKRTLRIAKQNIVFAIGVKAIVLILGALGFADMWLAVFADVGVAFLAILNSMRALRIEK
jgi:Cd2+/Zn2+-exporting ATPase